MAEEKTYNGRLYFKYWASKEKNSDIYESNEEVRKRLNTQLEEFKKKGYLKADVPDDKLLDFIEKTFFNDKNFTLFISNTTVGIPAPCYVRENTPQFCSVANKEDCILYEQGNSYIPFIVRPSADRPIFDEIFPSDYILSFKCRRQFCPHLPNGSVLQISKFIIEKKNERKSFEISVNAALVLKDKYYQTSEKKENIINADFLRALPEPAEILKNKLKEWEDYIDWRMRLIEFKDMGIRYISREIDTEENTVIFTVIAENENKFKRNQFWKREKSIFVRDFTYSSDPWSYKPPEQDQKTERMALRINLGDFIKMNGAEAYRNFIPHNCPWKNPYIASLYFSLPDNTSKETRQHKIPENGFISFNSGDMALIRRMKRRIADFKEGSIAVAARLSSYLFDITKARNAETDNAEIEFFHKNLNEDQKNAVKTMLAAPEIALVQGPPGTGKTTVIAEAVLQFLRQGKRVLLSSQSFAAVENALERIEKSSLAKIITFRKTWKEDDEDDQYKYFMQFIDSLGEPARKIIMPQKTRQQHIPLISEHISNIENQQNIISRVNADKNNSEQELKKYTEELRQAIAECEKNAGQISALHNLQKLRDTINSGNEEMSEFVPVPEALRSIFMQLMKPVCEELKKAGFSDTAEFLSSDQGNIAHCLKNHRTYFKHKIDLIQHDIFNSRQASAANNDEEEKIKNNIALVKANKKKAFDNNDSEQYEIQENFLKQLQAELKKINSQKGFSEEEYKKFLSEEKFLQMLALSSYDRANYLKTLAELLNKLKKQAADQIAIFMAELAKEIDKFKKYEALSVRRKKLEYGIKTSTDKIKCFDEKLKTIHESLNSYIKKINKNLKDIMQKPLSNPAETLDWLKKYLSDIKEQSDKFYESAKDIMPLYEKWLSILKRPMSDTDIAITYKKYSKLCNVIGITCTADTRMLNDGGYTDFDVSIIDEVSKATPPEMLMSMLMSEKTVLVGDHRQLPPLFGEKEPRGFEEEMNMEEENQDIPEEQKITRENFQKYEKLVTSALFKEYFEKAGKSIKCSLFTQYRMHPDIMRIINEFYDNMLKCDEKLLDQKRCHGIPENKISYIKPERHAYWIDSSTAPDSLNFSEEQSGTSKKNFLEALLICRTLIDLDNALAPDIQKEVAVISFYGHQTSLIRDMLRNIKFKHFNPKVDTVDRFQGREADYVLASFAATPRYISKHSHVAQFERVNVAFSRARELLLIYGASRIYSQIPLWLSPLAYSGKPKETYAYMRIIANLNRFGCLLKSSTILNRQNWIEDYSAYNQVKDLHRERIRRVSFKSLSVKAAKQ